MLAKLKKLWGDNSFKNLLSGNLAVTDAAINSFLARVGPPPPLKRLTMLCSKDVIEVEGDGEFAGIGFAFEATVSLLGLKITATEQEVRLMPGGPIRFTTDNLDVAINIRPGPDLLSDISSLLKFAPAGQVKGVSIEPDCIFVRLHEDPRFAEQFEQKIRELPLYKKFGVNPLDYVVINDMKIEPGAIRLFAKRT